METGCLHIHRQRKSPKILAGTGLGFSEQREEYEEGLSRLGERERGGS